MAKRVDQIQVHTLANYLELSRCPICIKQSSDLVIDGDKCPIYFPMSANVSVSPLNPGSVPYVSRQFSRQLLVQIVAIGHVEVEVDGFDLRIVG